MFLAGIGHVCLQWALLEQTVLAIIASAEDLPFDKVYTRYGGLDMQPRISMALKLAHEAKWPVRLTKKLEGIRRALQKGGENLAEKRNMFVHGVHKAGNEPGEHILTMARWSPGKRDQAVTALDAAALANRLDLLVQEADAVFRGYGVWRFGADDNEKRGERIARTKTTARFIRAQNVKRAIKMLLANVRP
jgi:hypothetical protein